MDFIVPAEPAVTTVAVALTSQAAPANRDRSRRGPDDWEHRRDSRARDHDRRNRSRCRGR